MSSPRSVRHSGQGTPQLKQTGMSLNQGIVQGSLIEKAQFSLGYAGSFLRHWSWHHSIILFVGLSPGFHPSVAILTSASILAFKWSKGLASLHTKFATTWCIFQVNFNLAILRLSTLNPNIKMNCQTAISYRGLRNDNKFEEGMIWASKQPWWVTIDHALLQVFVEKALGIINRTASARNACHGKMASSSSTCSASTQTIASKVKRVPPLFSDLLDLAIYSFGCQSGLRSNHKVRGNPVLEGVSAILGRMVLTSNPETKAAFEETSPTRLGNWLFLRLLYLGSVYMEVGDPR